MRNITRLVLAAAALASLPGIVKAASYAGEVTSSGTSGQFYLNEGASSYTINYSDGPSVTVNSPSAGLQSFTRPSAGDTFSISVTSNDGPGWTSGTALQVGADTSLTVFNSPRGVAVNQNPGADFGLIYVDNSAASAGSTSSAGKTRSSLGEGIYAMNSDQSDAFGYVNTAKMPGVMSSLPASTSLPYRLTVGSDNNLYVGDTSTTAGNIYQVNPNLTTGTNLLFGNPANNTTTATTDNHGEFFSKPIMTTSGGNTYVTAIDDLLGSPSDFNAIRTFNLGSTPGAPAAAVPMTEISNPSAQADAGFNAFGLPSGGLTTDLGQAPTDGRYYYMEDRAAGGQPGLFVVDPATGNILFDSLAETKVLNPSATADKLAAVAGMAISPDNKYVAFVTTTNGLDIVPLDATIGSVSGLPDLANMISITNAFPNATGNGRDIAFDAADNLYAVSSGDAMMRVMSPGGMSVDVTSFNGNTYSFSTSVPEPASLSLFGLGALGLLARRRK